MTRITHTIGIPGFLFSLCIAFWASAMAQHIQLWSVTRYSRDELREHFFKEAKLEPPSENLPLDQAKELAANAEKGLRISPSQRKISDSDIDAALALSKRQDGTYRADKLKTELFRSASLAPLPNHEALDLDDMETFLRLNVVPADKWDSIKQAALVPTVLVWWLTVLAGILFLADIACIMWWYATYIHKIPTSNVLEAHFLDLGVCAMFGLAATKWTEQWVFLGSTLIACILIGIRFARIYHSPESLDNDRMILRSALWTVTGGAVVSLVVIIVVFICNWGNPIPEVMRYMSPVLILVLSGIGVVLTVALHKKIRVAADFHENRGTHYQPMPAAWPASLEHGDPRIGETVSETSAGLKEFRDLFSTQRVTKATSRVHAESDVDVQSYVLATSSWLDESQIEKTEVKKKAFMVGVSHWLDDLVDGRESVPLARIAKDLGPALYTLERSEATFDQLYKGIVVQQTNASFYEVLKTRIKAQAGGGNAPYLFFGLNRVAIGAALFAPFVSAQDRSDLLDAHNQGIRQLTKKGTGSWASRVDALVSGMMSDPQKIGTILLGLTTKTVQELQAASEVLDVNFPLTLLHSLMYAPLVYYHNIYQEAAGQEMDQLPEMHISHGGTVNCIKDIANLLSSSDAPQERLCGRQVQLEMAFTCFESALPSELKSRVEPFYRRTAVLAGSSH